MRCGFTAQGGDEIEVGDTTPFETLESRLSRVAQPSWGFMCCAFVFVFTYAFMAFLTIKTSMNCMYSGLRVCGFHYRYRCLIFPYNYF